MLALSNQLCFAVYSASHAFNRAYRPLLEPLGLTYPQYLVMLILWEASGQSVGGIGERLGLDSNTLTPLIKRLEAAGHVRRARDTEDQRVVRVELTQSGRALREKAALVFTSVTCATGLPEAAAETLRHDLLALRDALNGAGPSDSTQAG
jgi:DNA-binding MarR family transcriptional regulator